MDERISQYSAGELKSAISKLIAYCSASDWAGHDPYDALNSPLFRRLPALNSRIPRLILTQGFKRSPVNLRHLFRIPKTQNPKAIALFLSAFVMLERMNVESMKGRIAFMIQRLSDLRSPDSDYWCWGYSFPWQTRTVIVPSRSPNLVCTSFVAGALLDAYEHCGDSRCLEMAVSAAEYIVNELYWTDGDAAGFSYPMPSLRSKVHNANLLAAGLLCRAYKHTKDNGFLAPALLVARYSSKRQNADGSWLYGEAESQGWIDNFHTGYNLCELQKISRYGETAEFDAVLESGFKFYRNHFFRDDGAVRYFHDQSYPIDVHCVAQSIITLLSFKDAGQDNLLLAMSVLRWALTNLWDDRGFFYYRALRFYTDRTPYMRWSQAWMLLAMVTLLERVAVAGIGSCGEPLAALVVTRG